MNYCENFKVKKGLICSSMWKAISPFQVEHFYILMTTTKSQRNSSTAWIHIAGCQQQKSIMFPRFACQADSNTDLIGQSDIAQDTFKNWLKLFHLDLNSAQWIYQCLKLGVLKNEIWRFSYQGCVMIALCFSVKVLSQWVALVRRKIKTSRKNWKLW